MKLKKYVEKIVLICYCFLEIIFFFIILNYIRSLSSGISYIVYFYVEISILLFIIFLGIEKIILKIIDKYEERKKILTPEDFIYYRDKLSSLSPAEMQFLLFHKIDFEDAIIASYLSLEMRGYVKIVDNKVIPLEKDISSLTNNEKCLLKTPRASFDENIFGEHFRKSVLQDCIDKHFVKKINFTKDFPILFYAFFFILYFLLLGIGVPGYDYLEYPIKLFAAIDMILPFFTLWSSGLYSMSVADGTILKEKHKLTEEGIAITQKIEGLKRYFNDFSILSNRSFKEVIL